jgi:hypothetical protein
MMPITVMLVVVAAHTVSPWNSTQACKPKKGNKSTSLIDGASCSNSKVDFNSKHRHGDKHDPATPSGNDEQTSTHQKQRKAHCSVKVDTAAKEKTELGMFYLRNTLITLKMSSQKTCLTRFVPILLARIRIATMSIATLPIPGGPQSSNVRLSWQSPIILPKEILVGSTSIIL